jgi:hypothetical protein
MIESVKQIVTVKAEDLPPTFDVRVGTLEIPLEVESMDDHYVYLIDDQGEVIYMPRQQKMTVLIPDTLENARLDIEFALMQDGLL